MTDFDAASRRIRRTVETMRESDLRDPAVARSCLRDAFEALLSCADSERATLVDQLHAPLRRALDSNGLRGLPCTLSFVKATTALDDMSLSDIAALLSPEDRGDESAARLLKAASRLREEVRTARPDLGSHSRTLARLLVACRNISVHPREGVDTTHPIQQAMIANAAKSVIEIAQRSLST